MPRDRAFQRAHEVLNYVGLGEVRYRAVDGFSAGSRQRCKLACALVHDPDLLILDEPTNGLDPPVAPTSSQLLREVNAAGIALLLSTHLLPDVQEVCEDVVVIGHGRAASRRKRRGRSRRTSRALASSRVFGDAAPLASALPKRGVPVTADEATGDLRVLLAQGQDNRADLRRGGRGAGRDPRARGREPHARDRVPREPGGASCRFMTAPTSGWRTAARGRASRRSSRSRGTRTKYLRKTKLYWVFVIGSWVSGAHLDGRASTRRARRETSGPCSGARGARRSCRSTEYRAAVRRLGDDVPADPGLSR